MYSTLTKYGYKIIAILLLPVFLWACSTKNNTSSTRLYHAINTKYNIYFNANEAYKEALKAREETYQDTLSQIINIYPIYPSKNVSFSKTGQNEIGLNSRSSLSGPFSGQTTTQKQTSAAGGSFARSIEKNTKAIKLHSIKSKPQRKASKRRDPKYQAWLQQQEFNPFLHNAWLLLGKSEYQDGDYLQAVSTFAYILRIYKSNPAIVAEARMWLAKSNIALGWYYEAEDIFNQIRLAGGIPDNLSHEFNKIYADFLIKKREYSQALPYLEKAIGKEKNRLQKIRMKYLLGQLYKRQGDRDKAYNAFDNVHGLNTPYFYSFNARIEQASFVDSANKGQILSMLEKMVKNPKNKEYQDQIYYAIGNIYLNDRDTLKAVDNYKKSVKNSIRNGYDKALTNVVLGDIYFTQRNYLLAQPIYSETLELLSKNDENYPLVSLRSDVLDELVVYAQAIHLQDSLQTLARMPESERFAVINRLITDLKKKEKEEKNRVDRDRLMAERELNGNTNNSLFDQSTPNIPSAPLQVGGESTFYFYNTQTVAQGKVSFQRKWGTRKLEDHWRRRDKQVLALSISDQDELADNAEQTQQSDKLDDQPKIQEDIYSPEFYLQQIPLTPEAIDASNVIIEDAYFNMGKIYKDKLQDYNLAIDAFETDLRRFPLSPNEEEIYYQLFLIYLRLGNLQMTELYRANILNAFPESSYAGALADPDYVSNMLNMHQVEESLYQQTYDYYLAGDAGRVRSNYDLMKQRYPLSTLMPKFKFLNTLTYAQSNNPKEFRVGLTELIAEYPKSDVTPLATSILKGLLNGKELSSDTSPFRGMIWDIQFGGDDMDQTIGVDFVANPQTEYMLLLVYKPKEVDKNQLIYEVANYNFSKFVYQTFDLGFNSSNGVEMLQVRGFKNLSDIITYIDMAFAEKSLMSTLDKTIIPIPISVDNYIALMNGKTLNEYFLFFEKNYTKEMITLIRYWNQQRNRPTPEHTELETSVKNEPLVDDKIQDQSEDGKVLKSDSNVVIKPEDSQFIPTSPNMPKPEMIKKDDHRSDFGFEQIMSDDQINSIDNIINKTVDVINNPVDGLKDLLKKSPDNSNETKEEREKRKAENRLKKAQEKQRKAEEKAKLRSEAQIEKARQDSIINLENEKIEAQQAIERANRDQEVVYQKNKENSLKQKEKERKEKEKARGEELKLKEKERKERLKQREKERKERLKQRELELKEKERQRRQSK